MQYIKEERLFDFVFWGGAVDTACWLDEEDFDKIEIYLENLIQHEEWTETSINDFFWFENDIIAIILGFSSFKELIKAKMQKYEE